MKFARACMFAVVTFYSTVAAAAPPTVEQVQQAFDIAEASAENGFVELSMKAVRRALQSGPPTVSTATPPPSVQPRGTRIDPLEAAPQSPLLAVQKRIPQAVRSLSAQWRQSANAEQIYDTLLHVVLPKGRPNEIFLYVQPAEKAVTESSPGRQNYSVAWELLTAAKSAKKTTDLSAEIEARGLEQSVEAALLLLLCAEQVNDVDGIERHSVRLAKIVSAGTSQSNVDFTADAGIHLLSRGDVPDAAATVLFAAAKTGGTIARLGHHDLSSLAVTLQAVRGCFAVGNTEQALELLELCLESGNADPRKPQSSGERSRIRRLVARELYGRALVAEAREMLGAEAAGFENRYRNKLLLPAGVEPLPPVASPPDSSGSPDHSKARILSVQSGEPAADQIWICSLDTETEESKVLFTLPDFQNVSYPVVSPTGQRLAFAATFPGEVVTSGSRLYVCDMAGTGLRELGLGTMPSWSPMGTRFVCSRYSPNRGVWTIRVDGGDFELLDENGWSGRWSPDGLKIAYTRSRNSSKEFWIKDLAEDEVLKFGEGGRETREQPLWNFSWLPDGKNVLFEARGEKHGGRFYLAVQSIDARQPNARLLNIADYFNMDLVPHPQRATVLIAPKLRKYGGERLHRLNREDPTELQYVPGQWEGRRNSGASWMPDGKTLVYLSRPEKQ